MSETYDVIIIGGGPAGLTAGLYTSRARLNTLLLEKSFPGGQIINTELVENYPGFPNGISGFELGQLLEQQALKHGLTIINDEVKGISLDGIYKLVRTDTTSYNARVVIIAAGAEYSKLHIPGEEEFTGRGVSYCATCDGAFYRDRIVAMVGGGNSAIVEAISLTKFVSKVLVIHRRNELRAGKLLQERAFANPRIEFIWDTIVESINGDDQVRSLNIHNIKTGEKSVLEVSGIFVSVGLHPSTDYLKGIVTMNANGYIITNDEMETETPGIFAAGDVRAKKARQVITAAGDGATAAISVERFLSES